MKGPVFQINARQHAREVARGLLFIAAGLSLMLFASWHVLLSSVIAIGEFK